MSTGAIQLSSKNSIVVLGAATTLGRKLATRIAAHPSVESLVLVDRGPRLEALSGRLRGAVEVVLEERTPPLVAAIQALSEGALVLDPLHVDPAHHLDLLRAAVEGGGVYIGASNDDDVALTAFDMHDRALSTGAALIPSATLSPGLTDVLVRLGSKRFGEVAEIEIAVARSSADARINGAPFDLLAQLSRRAPYLADEEPASTPSAVAPKPVFFPEPLGWVETFRCGHPEIQTLYKRKRGLRSLTYRLGVTERAVMDVARVTVRTGLVRRLARARTPRALTERVLAFLERLPPPGPSVSAIRVDVRGHHDDRRRAIALGIAGPTVELMALPMAHAALVLNSERGKYAGMLTLDEVADPKSLFEELGHASINLVRLAPSSV